MARNERVMSSWDAPVWFDRLGGVAWRLVAIVAALALIVLGTVALSSVIVPVMLGTLFACGLHPLAMLLRRKGLAPALASGVSMLLLVAAIVGVVWMTVNNVLDEWGQIESIIGEGRATLEDAAADGGLDSTTVGQLADDLAVIVPSVIKPLLQGVVFLVPTVASIATTLLLSFVAGFFFLKDGSAMWRWTVSRSGTMGTLVDEIGRRVWIALSGFIRGQTIIAAIDATAITAGALLLGVPEPAAIFLLTFLGAYIPFIGAFVSGLVAVMLALGDSGIPAGITMLAVVIAVQLVEGNVLQPWIQGRAVTLHPLVIALAVTAGGAIAGFLGVLLAVPLTAAGVAALSELRRAGIIGGAHEDAGETSPGDAAPSPQP